MLRVAVVAGPEKQTDTGLHVVLTCYWIPANSRRCRSWKNQLSWHNKYHHDGEAIFTVMSLHGVVACIFCLGSLMQEL